jgi:hypothetical protein
MLVEVPLDPANKVGLIGGMEMIGFKTLKNFDFCHTGLKNDDPCWLVKPKFVCPDVF